MQGTILIESDLFASGIAEFNILSDTSAALKTDFHLNAHPIGFDVFLHPFRLLREGTSGMNGQTGQKSFAYQVIITGEVIFTLPQVED
jgi:hypothetical protein